ncbi:Hypothetical predicted protein [Octopus vulgaris]|uniref:Uncharacterized protein n=1 Tax=Octopus vulgaris TaxID=6645 RepID=A0AA36BX26_OCTVU|nr:Hypothetical predicted protein [Octopus vulgaris]
MYRLILDLAPKEEFFNWAKTAKAARSSARWANESSVETDIGRSQNAERTATSRALQTGDQCPVRQTAAAAAQAAENKNQHIARLVRNAAANMAYNRDLLCCRLPFNKELLLDDDFQRHAAHNGHYRFSTATLTFIMIATQI